MEQGSLIRMLGRAGKALQELFDDEAGWQSLDVDYEPPRVERLWRPYESDHRLYLHRIHPCEQALFHPHPWPSAILLLSGRYEMGIGYGAGNTPPPIAATTILAPGTMYEMLDPDGWHYVRPLGGPSLSLMVTGPRWERWSPGPSTDKVLQPLTDDARKALFRDVAAALNTLPLGPRVRPALRQNRPALPNHHLPFVWAES